MLQWLFESRKFIESDQCLQRYKLTCVCSLEEVRYSLVKKLESYPLKSFNLKTARCNFAYQMGQNIQKWTK